MSFARAFAALTGASAVSMAAQLLRGKLAALVLGPAGVGVFNQLSLLWNLANVGGGLGTFNGIVQHGAEAIAGEDRAALRRLASTFTILLGGISLLIAGAGALFAAPLSHWLLHDGGEHAPLIALLMLGVPIGVTAQIYRALLSAGRSVTHLVRSQIYSDLGGAALFAALVLWLGLQGAIIGFMASHLILVAFGAIYLRRELGGDVLRPDWSAFDWSVVRSNIGFGASGLFLIVLVNLSVILVSRLIIDRFGAEANGYFANAWRISSVYLGAVTATTIGYFLPTLARSKDNAAMRGEVNATLRFYLLLLPPVMVGIMAGGEVVVWVILSKAFLPVAALLLLFVPAELMRVLADTLLAQFLARRRLRPYTAVYLIQFVLFVGLSFWLVPRAGITGAAVAYFIAMSASMVLAFGLCSILVDFRLERATLATALRAVMLLGAVVWLSDQVELIPLRLAYCALAGGAWLWLSRHDDNLRQMIAVLRGRRAD